MTPKKPMSRRFLLRVTAVGASAVLTGCGTSESSREAVGTVASDASLDGPTVDAGTTIDDAAAVGKVAHDAGSDAPTVDAGITISDAGGD